MCTDPAVCLVIKVKPSYSVTPTKMKPDEYTRTPVLVGGIGFDVITTSLRFQLSLDSPPMNQQQRLNEYACLTSSVANSAATQTSLGGLISARICDCPQEKGHFTQNVLTTNCADLGMLS